MKFLNRVERLSPHANLISILILAALSLLAIAGAIIARGLNTEYSINQFLDPKNPLLMAEFKVKEDFALPTWPYVYVTVGLNQAEQGTLLSVEHVGQLRAGTDEAASFPGVRKAISIANAEGASMMKAEEQSSNSADSSKIETKNHAVTEVSESLTIGKILDLTPRERWSSRVLEDPLLSPVLLSKDARTALIAVELESFDTRILSSLPEQLRQTFQNRFPKSEVKIGGIPAIQNEMGQLLKNELFNFVGLALIACLLTLAAFFKDKPSIFVPILLVGFANIAALAAMVLAKIPFTVLSTTLPVIVSIIVLSITTHTMINFAADWQQEYKSKEGGAGPTQAKLRAVIKTMRALFLPNFLTGLTTAMGFAALLTARVPLIRDYAKCVSVGVLIAWLCVTIALPPLLLLMPVPRPRSWTASKARWALHIEKNKKFIVLTVLVLAAGLAWEGRGLNWSARLFDDLPKEREARVTSELIDEKLGAIIPLDLIIRSKEADAWNDPDLIRSLKLLMDKIRSRVGVGSALGLADLLEAGSRAQNQPLPASRAGMAELIFLYSLSPERVTSQFMTSDGTQTRISVRLRDIPGDQMQSLVNSIRSDTESLFPGFEVQTVGMAANVHLINNELSQSLIYGFWQAILLISLVLLFVFRSLKWTIAAMLPNLMSPLALMGVMAFTHTAIKPGIALIFSIALGIAYNNTVYLLGRVRFLRQKSERRGDTPGALLVIKAWYQEGNPCVFSTLALVGGFAVFMASYFHLNRVFGAYMLLSIVAGMLGDLIFLPALLTWFPWLLESPVKRARQSS
ncbi:MAG: MMPL family transporter [Bdellovibrionales bacterium]|nr:MMPL family transporter [Oligoflexia bacterium]